MNRRTFLVTAAAGTAGVVLPARGAGHSPVAALANPRLLEILRNKRVVRELGRCYLDLAPAEDNPRALAQAILPEPPANSRTALRAQIDAQVQRDFAAGQTLVLNGWIVSVTEARQCALYSLLPA
jgi:hypothetical protein